MYKTITYSTWYLPSFNPLILETLSQQFCLFNWSMLTLREEKTHLISGVSSSKMFLVLDKSRVVKTEV